MDSPNNDADDNVYRYLDDYCPSPLNHPPVVPPPSPNLINAANNDNNNGDNGHNADFDFDIDDIINFAMDPDDNAEGGGELGTNGPSADAGPSFIKEQWFRCVPDDTLDCRRCMVASEIYDSGNGLYDMRLAVHTVAGNIDHLIFDAEATDFEVNSGVETFQMNVDGRSLEQLNVSLAEYAIQIDSNGLIIVLDSFIAIYNRILEKHIVWNQGGSSSSQSSDSNEDNTDMDTEGPGESSGNANPNNIAAAARQRPSVGIQRERTANMGIADLAPYFHMKAEDASKMLNICPTTLKILCRKLELGRWPHRKVKSIDNRIRKLRKQMREKAEARDMHAIANLQEEIEKEEEKKRRLYEHLTRPR